MEPILISFILLLVLVITFNYFVLRVGKVTSEINFIMNEAFDNYNKNTITNLNVLLDKYCYFVFSFKDVRGMVNEEWKRINSQY